MGRTAKLSLDMQPMHRSNISGLGQHVERKEGQSHSNPDIDDSKTKENYSLTSESEKTLLNRVDDRIAEGRTGEHSSRKIQKNAILIQAFVLQVNKEYFAEIGPEKEKEFFQAGYDHLCDKFGKENVIYGSVHKDEKAPHAHFGVIPLKDGKLIGGQCRKKEMAALHTDMHRALQERGFEIERGQESVIPKERISLAQFKAQELQQREQQLRIRELELLEKEKELKKIAGQEKNIKDAVSRAKKDKPMFGKEHIELSTQDFDMLVNTANAGARAIAENEQLKPLQEKVQELEKDNKYLTIRNADLTKDNKKLNETIGKQNSTIKTLGTRNYKRYSAKGLSDKQCALVMMKADGIPKNIVATTVGGASGSAPSQSDKAREYGNGVIANALKMDSHAVALTMKMGDEFDNWDCLTAEARAEKAKAMGLGIE